jgi:two-component system phosphate regulon sensor histidine kinase PhoR
MKKRIYRNMLLLTAIAVTVTSLLVALVMYREFNRRMQQEIKNEARFLSIGYNKYGEGVIIGIGDQILTSRITWIDSDGTVLYDSATEAETMENHGNRPEVINALENGFGQAVHISNTLGTRTFYYAILLNDGTVLRISAAAGSVYKAIISFIPYMLFISLLVLFLTSKVAGVLTQKIVVPLNNLNLDDPLSNDIYDELSPLLSRMAKQKRQIQDQFDNLKNKQDEFSAIADNISEGIIVLDGKGFVLSINKSAERIFDLDSSYKKVSKHILMLNRSITVQRAVEAALKGQSYEDAYLKEDRSYNILANPVMDGDKVRGIVLLILDRTEKISAENMRREFSANVSHELKTPLTSISGYAELIKNGMVKPEDTAMFAERIYNEARHLISLVEDIIQISKLDEKNIQLPFEDVDLLKLAREVADRLSPLALQKQIKMTVKGEKAVVRGVRPILEETIYNLCDNAIKYNYENGKVDVTVKPSRGKVVLIVADNGFGIPEAHQERIFERFYRIDKSHSKDTGGTGLGLSIVKHSAEFHDAKIELQSSPGKGTTISVIFNAK